MDILDKFGKVIAEDLRDSALNRYLDIESGWVGAESEKELSSCLTKFTDEQRRFIRKLFTDCIDTGIQNFLSALEENRNGLSIYVEGQDLSGISDGLQDKIFAEKGWYEKFSQHQEDGI